MLTTRDLKEALPPLPGNAWVIPWSVLCNPPVSFPLLLPHSRVMTSVLILLENTLGENSHQHIGQLPESLFSGSFLELLRVWVIIQGCPLSPLPLPFTH